MADNYSFPKKQRLTGEIRIGKLFLQGKSFIAYPLRVVYLADEKREDTPARIVINVPKRRMKKAVDRNLLKRRIREAYRLHKEDFLEKLSEKNYTLNIGVNYVANEEQPFSVIEKKMIEALNRIADQLP